MASTFQKFRGLFFIKRRPKPFVPVEWDMPKDKSEFQKILEWEGFISPDFWSQDDLTGYPTVKQDLDDLEEHLLPAFFEFNQKATHYQNRFYYYQWIFMGGAFLTTLFGALTTYAYTRVDDGGGWADIFGVTTAVISGATAYYNVRSDQTSPQKRWAKARRLAEELRMNYYKYISHMPPFDTDERVQEMRRMVINVRRKELDNG
ncbi:MAG TPA: DUF4231 domain-containing protein [Aggregatilineales bacterium]|nr:DUF4231 domain-containing protein [Aggregatilineales bacterium]